MSDRNKQVVSYRENRDLKNAIDLVQEILDNLKNGPITVQQNDQSLTVTPSADVKLTIKAKKKDEDESIEFKMKWSSVAPAAQVLSGDGEPISKSDSESKTNGESSA